MAHAATVAGSERDAVAANWSWDQMLDDFRAFGGVAENICRREGTHGRGLFAVDRGKPSRIVVPEVLLIHADRIFFEDGLLRVKDVRGPAEQFFEKYQNSFSWGGGGREDCEEKLGTLQSIPADVLAFVTANFEMPAFHDTEAWIRQKFVTSRMVRYANRWVLMPVLDLVNHGHLAKFADTKGLEVRGVFESELLVSYNYSDALSLFGAFGFPSRERKAYSVSMQISHDARRLVIGRRLDETKKGEQFFMPTVEQNGARIALSHLMIGNALTPRLPRAIFQKSMRGTGVAGLDELFDRIVHTNNQKLFDLLALLENHDGQGVPVLRKVIHYQLEGIAQRVGTRDL